MTRWDSEHVGPRRRPALVDELERMGFQPTDPAEPVAPDAVPADVVPADVVPANVVPANVVPADVVLPETVSGEPGPDESVPSHAVPFEVVSAGLAAPDPMNGGPASTPGRARTGQDRGSAGELTAGAVLRARVHAPAGGWRRATFVASFGAINPGPSAAERRDRDLVARATRPVPGCWRIAVISLKGGVGKTTTTAGLGVQLATLRGDRVIAVDANPDRGTLAEKVPAPNPATVRDLLRHRDRITRYSDVRAFTSLSPSRLEVLASDADPTASQAFSEQDYRDVIGVLEHFYSLVLTDCGTGLLHSAMSGVLALADSLVVVSSASLDGARSASATLDWLEAHGRADLVQQAVAVVSSVRPRGGLVDVDAVQEHFARRCRAVVQIPFDPHLEAGATVSLEQMSRLTRQAHLELAAAVGDGLP